MSGKSLFEFMLGHMQPYASPNSEPLTTGEFIDEVIEQPLHVDPEPHVPTCKCFGCDQTIKLNTKYAMIVCHKCRWRYYNRVSDRSPVLWLIREPI